MGRPQAPRFVAGGVSGGTTAQTLLLELLLLHPIAGIVWLGYAMNWEYIPMRQQELATTMQLHAYRLSRCRRLCFA